MPYVAEKPLNHPDLAEVRSRVEGWGVDLNPQDRPGVPKERFLPDTTGAHWYFPERQIPNIPREKSPEHASLTPVFGTACPLKGLSGAIRRYAYTFSEGRTAHWTLLVLADRVDVLESRAVALLSGRPDNPLTETGLLAEVKRHGIESRVGQGRADLIHQPVDVLLYLTKGLLFASAVYAVGAGINRARHRRRSWF